MSSWSSAAVLSDDTRYPNLARFWPNEKTNMMGVVEIMMHYNWTRIGVLADDGLWAQDTMKALKANMKARCPACEVTNSGNETFPEKGLSSGSITASGLLERLRSTDTKIAIVIAYGDTQRKIFRAIEETRMLQGKGYAWLTALMDPASYTYPNGTVDPVAARGANGVLGVVYSASPEKTSVGRHFANLYRNQADTSACAAKHSGVGGPYCINNADKNFADKTQFGTRADAVVAYARAVDDLINNQGLHPDNVTAARIYDKLLTLRPFDGVEGDQITLSSSTGDLLGMLSLLNIRATSSVTTIARPKPITTNITAVQEMHSAIEVEQKLVATIDARSTPNVLQFVTNPDDNNDPIRVLFPGATTDVPSDGRVIAVAASPIDTSSSCSSSVGCHGYAIMAAVMSLLVATYIIVSAWRYHTALKIANAPTNFEQKLEWLEKSGLVDPEQLEHAIENLPREVKRANLEMIDRLGHGRFIAFVPTMFVSFGCRHGKVPPVWVDIHTMFQPRCAGSYNSPSHGHMCVLVFHRPVW